MGKDKRAAFFRHLLHDRVPPRVDCAASPLTTSRKIASSMRYGEQVINAVQSCLTSVRVNVKTNDAHVHVLCRTIRKQNIDIETIVETKC